MADQIEVYVFQKPSGHTIHFVPASMEKITLALDNKHPSVVEKITATEKMLLLLLGVPFPTK